MKRTVFLLILATAVGYGGWIYRDRISSFTSHLPIVYQPPAAKPDPDLYRKLKTGAAEWRQSQLTRYRASTSQTQRDQLLDETGAYLENLLPRMMHCWTGTPWDFNGTAAEPGGGKIACGYFVATVLKDAGFQVDRYKLARQPSQNILLTFLPKSELTIRAGVSYEDYAESLRAAPPGIRIVGLDHHVGFLVTTGGSFQFIHSSGLSPWCVVNENEKNAEALRRSNYRVQGLLTGNRGVLLQWLKGTPLTVREHTAAPRPAGKATATPKPG